jgi:hypothetical protein
MSRYAKPGRNSLVTAAFLSVGLVLVAGLSACTDEATRPRESAEEAVLKPGVNVYLTVDNDAATPGTRITLTGKVRAVDVALTPTGYLVDVVYDPEKLQPIEAATLDDGVLRAINLTAGPGLVKAAGAAPNGLKSDVLFAIEMEVAAADYVAGLEVQVHELTVIEQDFGDVTLDVVMPSRAVVVGR